MNKKILLINDIAGYGKVALSAMIPVLSHMNCEVFNLPTAVVSNTLDYGKFTILDTTEYMKKAMDVWEELGFSFNAISTGFIVSEEQTKIISEYCNKKANKDLIIFSDPIMGDEGVLYNGVKESTVDIMRNLIGVADYIVPNYTEAAYLANVPYKKTGASLAEYKMIIEKLRELGARSVVITSAIVENGKNKSVIGYDHKKDEYFNIEFEEVPVRFPGTGDIFSAIFIGNILNGKSLYESTKSAMKIVKQMIIENADNVDKYKGIPIEMYLDMIEEK